MEAQRRPALHQRRFWILPDFQGRMVRHWVVLSLGSAVLTSGVLLAVIAYLSRHLNGEYMFVEIPKEALGALGGAHFVKLSNIILASSLAASLLGCIIAMTAGIFYSHRIAGPLFRIRRTIGDSLDGKSIEPIMLRESDELKELADDINRILRGRKG